MRVTNAGELGLVLGCALSVGGEVEAVDDEEATENEEGV